MRKEKYEVPEVLRALRTGTSKRLAGDPPGPARGNREANPATRQPRRRHAWLRGRARKAAPSSLPELPSIICSGRGGTRFVLSSLAVRRPIVRVRYEAEEAGGPSFEGLLAGPCPGSTAAQ